MKALPSITGTVSYLLDSGTVAYAKGDAEEEIVLPESETVIVGNSITLAAPATTTLADGKKFMGWMDKEGKLYKAGDVFAVDAAVTFTLTAVWELCISFTTGYEESGVFQSDIAVDLGEKFALPNDLRGTIVNDGKYDLVFYGWNIGGKIRFAGETLTMDGADLSAEAVWVPAIFVDGTNGNDEEADGTRAKPYQTLNAAYKALGDLLSDRGNTDAAGAVYLLSDAAFAPIDDSVYYRESSSVVALQSLNMPILFTAATANTVCEFKMTTQIYIYFNNDILFDNVSVAVTSESYPNDTNIRMYPSGDLYFGLHVKTEQFVIDCNQLIEFSADCKVYNGTFKQINMGGASSVRTMNFNLYFGNGTKESTPFIDPVFPNGQKNVNSLINAEFRSGTVNTLDIRKSGTVAANDDRKLSGDLICKIYKGITLTKITDGAPIYCEQTYNNKQYTDTEHMHDMSRTIIFNGFCGSVYYGHGTVTGSVEYDHELPNGLDAIAFINGANVTFTNHAPRIAARANGIGNVYVDATSTYTGKDIIPVYYDHENEVEVDGTHLSPIAGTLHTWNGTEWTTDVYGAALGAQRRTTAPYGIRFGFVGSTATLEAMFGQKVTKGILLIPTALLNETLELDTENVLNVEAKVSFSLSQPNVFTAMLIDDYDNSSEKWLETWENVEFTARAYFELADGTVFYSDSITKSIASINQALTEMLPA